MTEVVLHVYEVSGREVQKTNIAIMEITRYLEDNFKIDKILHYSIQVYEDTEWSFGFCKDGTGVFSCPSEQNPIYTYRDRLVLGTTKVSMPMVDTILNDLSRVWHGNKYDLILRNSKDFCDEVCNRIGVPKAPDSVDWLSKLGHSKSLVALSLGALLRHNYKGKAVLYKPRVARFLKNLNQTFDELEQRVHGIRMVREDAELYCIQLDQLLTREEWYAEAQKLHDKGDAERALNILLAGCTTLKDDEGLWLDAYYMSDMNTAKMVIKRALSFIPDSKPFLALKVAFKYMDDQVEVDIAMKTMIYRWIGRGRVGGEHLWLQTATMLEEEYFTNACTALVKASISVEDTSSWREVQKQLLKQDFVITLLALDELIALKVKD